MFNLTIEIEKIDEKNLKKLASDMGISYIHMDKQSRIDSKLEKLKNETANKVSKTEYKIGGKSYENHHHSSRTKKKNNYRQQPIL